MCFPNAIRAAIKVSLLLGPIDQCPQVLSPFSGRCQELINYRPFNTSLYLLNQGEGRQFGDHGGFTSLVITLTVFFIINFHH